MFFNKALTDNEIAAIYNAGSGINRTVAYDNAGNLVLDNKGYSYKWDHENHLVAIYKNNGTTLIAEMVYDALGRRVRRTLRVPGSPGSSAMSAANTSIIQTDYYYNGWQVLTEVVTDSDLEVSSVNYAYGNALDEVLFYATDDGTNQTVSYLLHDHLNSPVARIDSSGAILERYEYDAYGKRTVFNADYTQQLASSVGTNIGFTGQRVEYFDGDNLELCYYKNRWYYPAFGRMLSIDPLGVTPNAYMNGFSPMKQYVDGLNIYCYVGNEPVLLFDIYGTRLVGESTGVDGWTTIHFEGEVIFYQNGEPGEQGGGLVLFILLELLLFGNMDLIICINVRATNLS